LYHGYALAAFICLMMALLITALLRRLP